MGVFWGLVIWLAVEIGLICSVIKSEDADITDILTKGGLPSVILVVVMIIKYPSVLRTGNIIFLWIIPVVISEALPIAAVFIADRIESGRKREENREKRLLTALDEEQKRAISEKTEKPEAAPERPGQEKQEMRPAEEVRKEPDSDLGIPAKAYEGRKRYVFLSYAHRNIKAVLGIIQNLQKNGYRVWYDEGITPGSEWDENIASHIEKCSCFIALMSGDYMRSSNCKDELNFARDQDKPILLVYLEDTQLPGGMRMRLDRKQAIYKFRYRSEEEFYKKLFEAEEISACR